MLILLTNDDGVESQAFGPMREAIADLGRIVVAAPEKNMSGVSHALTLDRPLKATELGPDWYCVNGTPADCVYLALGKIFKGERPDLVVSGINQGGNMGEHVIYSGTVAAAKEAVLHGIPSLAVSLVGEAPWRYEAAAGVMRRVIDHWRKRLLPAGTLLNLNVPNLPAEALGPIRVTRQGRRIKYFPPKEPLFWQSGLVNGERMTDLEAVQMDQVSLTPMHADRSFPDAFEELDAWSLA